MSPSSALGLGEATGPAGAAKEEEARAARTMEEEANFMVGYERGDGEAGLG